MKNNCKLILFITLFVSGCSTIVTQGGYSGCEGRCSNVPQVFSGTAANLCCFSNCGSVGSSFAILDLPFSFIADTLILPVTIYKQVVEGSICYVEDIDDEVFSDEFNYIPMFGFPDHERSASQNISDKQFIKRIAGGAGSLRKASKKYTTFGWIELRKGNPENAIYLFNQSWLLDPTNYQAFWGFGSVVLAGNKPKEAVMFFEKSLDLVNDDKQINRLLVDTAKAYVLLGSDIKKSDRVKSDEYFRKSISLIEKALTINPGYYQAYFIGATSYYQHGDYKSSWEIIKRGRTVYKYDPFDSKFIRELSAKMPEPN